jgi:hypothetical protein
VRLRASLAWESIVEDQRLQQQLTQGQAVEKGKGKKPSQRRYSSANPLSQIDLKSNIQVL